MEHESQTQQQPKQSDLQASQNKKKSKKPKKNKTVTKVPGHNNVSYMQNPSHAYSE